MKFLSLFSGIEAASVAWLPLGWECKGVAEIEKFPCAVLAHHYPDVPNLGDITKITEEDIKNLGHIDLVVGGSPCQDVSVAGKRKGFSNDDGTKTRSGLFFDYIRIIGYLRKHCGLRYTLLENVPGLFTSNQGRDFAAVVSEMVGAEFAVPQGGWKKEGAAVGQFGMLEWCVLDAQWRGLAQRRKRVFALADFGDWQNRPPILLEPKSMSGNTQPCRPQKENVASDAGKGVEDSSLKSVNSLVGIAKYKNGTPPTLRASGGDQGGGSEALVTFASTGEISHCLNAGGMGRIGYETETLIAFGHQNSHTQGISASEDITPTLDKSKTPAIAIDLRHGVVSEVASTLLSAGMDTERGLPINATPHTFVESIGSFQQNSLQGRGSFGWDENTIVARPVKPQADHQMLAIAFAQNTRDEVREMNIVGALAAQPGMKQTSYIREGYSVRRLTPKECCRLQGFPDEYLDITFRNKPASDGPKYKALGNSFAVPVIRYIGEKIEMAAQWG